MQETRTYYVYIMASASRVLYTGVTNDLARRVWEHKQKLVPGFTRKYNVMRLVYCYVEPSRDIDAVERETSLLLRKIAKDMLDYCLDAFGFRKKNYEILAEFKGAVLEGQKCVHPLVKRDSVLILAPFVTLEAGTGAVHIAPGHGQEDYEIGLRWFILYG